MTTLERNARSIGLTRKQFNVYSLLFDGLTQAQAGIQLNMRQQRVSETLARALRRNPQLPALPVLARGRRGRARRARGR